ncbi:hypothetical protein [Sutcliffiella rhizosphaerae]|uniref:Uncharacterized protein n=1 Tax=Sutcliffiella rhizosphaerae TaxID=2880967 RepID=A0ABN8AAM0_9BACI|nr:hypothetical protein [Sutcliffiella rhizosphaerae]CAG9621514.1 hypothetical protein BACCIP111883_02287 [Sutcliffiella rhizosphaerae]
MNETFIKKKGIVTLISVTITLLLLGIGQLLENVPLLSAFTINLLVLFVIFIIGIPVNVCAGIITKQIGKFPITINFFLHILPALIIDIYLFKMIPYGLSVLIASIFFVVDTLFFHSPKNILSKTSLLIVPIILFMVLAFPRIMDEHNFNQVTKDGTPDIELTVNNETVIIQPSSCWSSAGSQGCQFDTIPYLLPLEWDGIDEFFIEGEVTIEMKFESSLQVIELTTDYLYEDNLVKIDATNNRFVLPADIKEQVVVVNATLENSQKLMFTFGIRNGNR